MMPVAILAGGLATRLRPLSEKIPKSLVEVAGEPFLAHQLRLLRTNGVERAVLCCGYLGEMVEAYAGDGSRFGLEIRYSFDGPQLQGTAGALRRALPLLGDRFFSLYGDSYLPVDFRAVEQHFQATGKPGLMTVYRNEGAWDTSNVVYEDGQILLYDKRNRTPGMRYIDYGLGAFSKEAFDRVPPQGTYDLASLYQQLLAEDLLASYEVTQRFYEIGSFAGIEELSAYLGKDR